MFNAEELKNLERKAFRATHQDGLWDIYTGGIVMSMATLAYVEESDAFPFVRFGLFLLGMAASFLIYWGGKKYLTTPRLGQVKFGPRRQQRKRMLISILSGIVLVQILVLVGTVLLWKNPQWAASVGFNQLDQDLERLVVAMVGALFVGPSTALIAYFKEFMRGYYIAAILALAVFALIWFGQPIYLIAAGLLIALPGVVLLIRFLRTYPIPPRGVES